MIFDIIHDAISCWKKPYAFFNIGYTDIFSIIVEYLLMSVIDYLFCLHLLLIEISKIFSPVNFHNKMILE